MATQVKIFRGYMQLSDDGFTTVKSSQPATFYNDISPSLVATDRVQFARKIGVNDEVRKEYLTIAAIDIVEIDGTPYSNGNAAQAAADAAAIFFLISGGSGSTIDPGTFVNSIPHWNGAKWVENPILTVNGGVFDVGTSNYSFSRSDGADTTSVVRSFQPSVNETQIELSITDFVAPAAKYSKVASYVHELLDIYLGGIMNIYDNGAAISNNATLLVQSYDVDARFTYDSNFNDGTNARSTSIRSSPNDQLNSLGAVHEFYVADSNGANVMLQQVANNNAGNPIAYTYLSINWLNGVGSNEVYIRDTTFDAMVSTDVPTGGGMFLSQNSAIAAGSANAAIIGGRNMAVNYSDTVGLGGSLIDGYTSADAGAVAGTYTMVAGDRYIQITDATVAGTIALIVPGAAADNFNVTVYNADGAAVAATIDGGTQTIDQGAPATTFTLGAKKMISLKYDGAVWRPISFVDVSAI